MLEVKYIANLAKQFYQRHIVLYTQWHRGRMQNVSIKAI